MASWEFVKWWTSATTQVQFDAKWKGFWEARPVMPPQTLSA